MISAGPQLPPSDAASTLKSAAGAGFSTLVWRHEGSLFGDGGSAVEEAAALARKTGLRLVVELDPALFPAGHPLVVSHPQAFRLRRAPADHAPVDPRKPAPVTGEAWARLHETGYASVFEEPLRAKLGELVRQGVGGFRIARLDAFDPALLRRLVQTLRQQSPDLLVLGGVESAEKAGDLGDTVDFLVAAHEAGDARNALWLHQLESLRSFAPVLLDARDPGGARDPVGPMREAAALADGLIVPLETLLRDPAAAGAAAALADELAGYSGSARRVSGARGPVTAILRGDAADLRVSQQAVLVLINCSQAEAAPPVPEALSCIAAEFAPFGGAEGSQAPLAPGEVRVLTGHRARAVAQFPAIALDERTAPSERVVVDQVGPSVDGGDFAIKRVVGDLVAVEATIFADGHEKIAAELRWRALDEDRWQSARMEPLDNDRWSGSFRLGRLGRHEFTVEGWIDRFGGYRRDLGKKVDAGVAQPVDFAEGRQLLEQAAKRSKGDTRTALERQLATYDQANEGARAAQLLSDDLAALMEAADDRAHRHVSAPQPVDAERIEAHFSSWYEIFPRSITDDKARHGTFADVIDDLPRVRSMGFDTLYFPPIHPIGTVNRKGPNNTLTPGPGDPGSPYAIGSAEGGHDAIHPELGSFADFDRLVEAAAEHGLEIALDFAIQCAPDHPWLKEHPGWFAWRPDGSMKYAENPPKKYQDIVNVDFYGPDAVPGLWEALRDVVLLWIEHGVKTFRVDNPHTKPLPFWEWMIADIRAKHPEAIFLSEAFTRPTMMYQLAKVGFSQSYTYFTWRDRKHELVEYITELTSTAPREFYRPHFFVNTPDINPFFLQTSGRPGFRIRAVLAATLSGLWGVYSGFELCESAPLGPGKEEYLDSEKYEIRPRPSRAPGDIVEDVILLNRLRRAHPALQTHLNTRFYNAWNDNVIWYGKPSPDGTEMVMVMANLDPHHPQECDFEVPLWEFGLGDGAGIAVEDLAEGARFEWHGKNQHIRLAPDEPYRIWLLSRPGGTS